jgi:hypothetical protein
MRRVAALLGLLGWSVSGQALAAPTTPDRSHRMQGGVGVTVGSGYRVLFKYGDADNCGAFDETNNNKAKNTCTSRLPTWLDAKLFFGVSRSVDVVIEHRFGLETDFTLNHQFVLMPGIRIYPSDPTSAFKFFVQIQAVFDYSEPGGSKMQRFDLGIHEANGFQWDFSKWGGAYLQLSETFGFWRSFDFQLEGGAGVEGRFP